MCDVRKHPRGPVTKNRHQRSSAADGPNVCAPLQLADIPPHYGNYAATQCRRASSGASNSSGIPSFHLHRPVLLLDHRRFDTLDLRVAKRFLTSWYDSVVRLSALAFVTVDECCFPRPGPCASSRDWYMLQEPFDCELRVDTTGLCQSEFPSALFPSRPHHVRK